jgi:hypothetical protein
MMTMYRARDRINLYPAAPIRLATMLNAWIITERWDGANLFVGTLAKQTWSRTSDPPTLSVRRTLKPFYPLLMGKVSYCVLTIAPSGIRPCSR